MYTFTGKEVEVTRINNDVNGNPRYVIGYRQIARMIESAHKGDSLSVGYDETVAFVRGSGFGRFHNKQYGGGLKFQSYNVQDDLNFLTNWVKSELFVNAVCACADVLTVFEYAYKHGSNSLPPRAPRETNLSWVKRCAIASFADKGGCYADIYNAMFGGAK